MQVLVYTDINTFMAHCQCPLIVIRHTQFSISLSLSLSLSSSLPPSLPFSLSLSSSPSPSLSLTGHTYAEEQYKLLCVHMYGESSMVISASSEISHSKNLTQIFTVCSLPGQQYSIQSVAYLSYYVIVYVMCVLLIFVVWIKVVPIKESNADNERIKIISTSKVLSHFFNAYL